MAKLVFLVTVDTEAQPRRAVGEPIEELIYGRFGGEAFGISRMMDAADRVGVGLTFFLDFAERDLYGDTLLDVGKLIRDRGHDLQVHIHPEFLDRRFFVVRSIPRLTNFYEMPIAVSDPIADYCCDMYESIMDEEAVAFRGGGYRYGKGILESLSRRGVSIASNYNFGRNRDFFDAGLVPVFRWQGGLIEFPVTCLPAFRNIKKPVEYNFNSGVFFRADWSTKQFAQRHMDFIDCVAKLRPDLEVVPIVLVMHSWSLLERNDDGRFFRPSPLAAERFERLLKIMVQIGQVKTMKEFGATEVIVDDCPEFALSETP